MPTPNIVLKDKTGNSVPYEGVQRISVEGHGWDGEDVTFLYTRLASLNLYFIKEQSDGKYLVVDYSTFGALDTHCACDITDKECQELGNRESDGSYSLSILYTLKSLTVGNAYNYAELY